MWLSRAGVIEQADSAAASPTITAAGIGIGTPNTINFTTSENCTYTSATGITVTTNASAAVTVTTVSGTDTAGAVTLSRNIVGGETIKLIFAAVNGVTSQATGVPIAAVTFSVTNNAAVASTPQFGTFTWSSAAAGTSLTSDANGSGAVFPAQASGLAVQFPNWVGYGAAGSAVTDTSVKINTTGFESGFTAGNALTGFTCTLVTNTAPVFSDSGTPYFVGGGSSSRAINLSAPQLALIDLPTITSAGKLQGLVEFDILSLLSTALGTPITLEYTDAVPASNAPGGTNGTQTSSFFLRVSINGVDDAGEAWAQELDVRTSEVNPYDGAGNLSGPITATPTLVSVRLCELDNPDNVVGQVATVDNNWDLGIIESTVWPNGPVSAAELRVVFQANSYVYNNPISVPPTTLIFDGAQFEFIALNPGAGNVITYEGGLTAVNLDGANPPFPLQPQPASVPITAGGGAVDGGFSLRVNPNSSDDPLIPTKAFDGSPPGNYPFQINFLSPGGLSEIIAYGYGGPTTDQTPIAAPPGIVVSGTYLVV